jgi:hypothetical protein
MGRVAIIALAVVFVATSCSKEPEPPLHAYGMLGSTAQDLIERLGEPTQYNEARLVRWKNFNGVRVFANIDAERKVNYSGLYLR